MVIEKQLRIHVWLHKEKAERAHWDWSECFETPKLAPRDTPPLTRAHLFICLKQLHKLGTTYSNI